MMTSQQMMKWHQWVNSQWMSCPLRHLRETWPLPSKSSINPSSAVEEDYFLLGQAGTDSWNLLRLLATKIKIAFLLRNTYATFWKIPSDSKIPENLTHRIQLDRKKMSDVGRSADPSPSRQLCVINHYSSLLTRKKTTSTKSPWNFLKEPLQS